MESCNSAHRELFHGTDGTLTGSGKEPQEMSMPAPHLLQSALVRLDTLLLQDILSEEQRHKRRTDAGRRVLSPLFRTHVNPYGRCEP
ncbi:Tn3 family transposase [Streptomyces luteocolor]|uniref:Tn3 family transposase n=1 Tax=Streptomyces luteocolor TaxID=285500 RepID=UPI0008536D6C|nr:Tn3 family transposase [Streptomyces luteocolor]